MYMRSITMSMTAIVCGAMVASFAAEAQLATNLNQYSVTTMNVGTTYFSDRTFSITSMPASLAGAEGIRTQNDHKDSNAASWITFDVSQNVYVYVAYDNRAAGNPPPWLQAYEDTGLGIGVTDTGASPHRLFRKLFNPGQVVLPGNVFGGIVGTAPGSMYFVLITAVPLFVQEPQSQAALEGSTVTFTAELGAPVNPVTYQWQKDQADLGGETDMSLTLTAVTDADEGNYRCVVTDGSSKGIFITNEALLLVSGGAGTPVAGPLGIAALVLAMGLSGAFWARRRSRA
jgi:hypothetical protein